jgi:transposase
MSAPKPIETRKAVIALTGKMEIEEIAATLDIGRATVTRLRRQFRETGTLEPKKPERVGRQPTIDEEGEVVLRALLIERSDATLEEFAALFEERTGKTTSDSAVSRAFAKMGISRKKKRCAPRSGKRRASRR